jgi:hypothetical protein
MKTRILDTPAKRISIAVAIVAGLILLAAAIYFVVGIVAPRPANGLKIIAAAHAYTRALQQRHLPIPQAVPLQVLIDQGLLQPADIGSFRGLDANIFLTAGSAGPTVLMRVHMPDGTDLVLLADGNARKIKR